MTNAEHIHVRTSYASRSGRVTSRPKPVTAKKLPIEVVRATPKAAKRAAAKSLVVTPRPVKQVVEKLAPITPSHKVSGIMDVKRGVAHVKAHSQQPARTLMRAAVKRPSASLKRRVHAQTRTDVLATSPKFEVAPKLSIEAVDAQRKQRAEHIAKSNLIRRFAPDKASYFHQPQTPVTSTRTVHHASTKAPIATPQNHRSMDIFQKALVTATAHEQAAVEPKRIGRKLRPIHHSLTSVVTLSAAVLLLGAFFAYQNKADITSRFASAKAGFHVVLPSYQPAGYAVGKFTYSEGNVAVNYAKAGTSRTYTLSQKTTNLTSTMLPTAVAKGETVQTLQQGMNTIYVYGSGNAAWVNQGVLYQITSNDNLSTSDILSIATSV